MLSDREKMVLHFCCMITIAKLGNLPHKEPVIEQMVSDIRNERCRSLSEKDVQSLLEDINQEMVGGRNMFDYLIDKSMRKPSPNDREHWK